MRVNCLPKSLNRQRRDCDLNPGHSAPESSTLTTRLPSYLHTYIHTNNSYSAQSCLKAERLCRTKVHPYTSDELKRCVFGARRKAACGSVSLILTVTHTHTHTHTHIHIVDLLHYQDNKVVSNTQARSSVVVSGALTPKKNPLDICYDVLLYICPDCHDLKSVASFQPNIGGSNISYSTTSPSSLL